MDFKQEFSSLVETLKTERDELKLKLHLASMEAKEEFDGMDEKWDEVVAKASELADDSKEVTEEALAKAKVVAEEVKAGYQRIAARLSGE